METVKVDIQKLQLLNDRIAQTIEALNQVRQSVHGIQHASSPVSPYGQQPWGQQPWGQQPWGQQPWGFSPYATMPFAPQYAQPFAPWQGLSHTTAPLQPWTNPQWTTPQWTSPQWTSPQWTTPFTTGLAHTTWEPSWQTRTPTTFPWAQGWWTTPTMF